MQSGDSAGMVRTRRALLDALEGLGRQRESVVVVGAQAVFIHTGSLGTAIALTTKDSDLAVDPGSLGSDPLLEDAMSDAGFARDLENPQPGIWISSDGVQVDLLVPKSLAEGGGRGARIPPHHKHATRLVVGMEASILDNSVLEVGGLDDDSRQFKVKVAGPAALIVSKVHKIHDRLGEPDRLNDKDAHDIYRLLVATPEAELAASLARLAEAPVSGTSTVQAVEWFEELFGGGPESEGCRMAGATEEGVGDPDVVALSTFALAERVLAAMRSL